MWKIYEAPCSSYHLGLDRRLRQDNPQLGLHRPQVSSLWRILTSLDQGNGNTRLYNIDKDRHTQHTNSTNNTEEKRCPVYWSGASLKDIQCTAKSLDFQVYRDLDEEMFSPAVGISSSTQFTGASLFARVRWAALKTWGECVSDPFSLCCVARWNSRLSQSWQKIKCVIDHVMFQKNAFEPRHLGPTIITNLSKTS